MSKENTWDMFNKKGGNINIEFEINNTLDECKLLKYLDFFKILMIF